MSSSDIFEGIAAVSQMGMAIAVGLGVWVAYRQLGAWRHEKKATKLADLGEELIAVVSEISVRLQGIRSAMGYGAPDGEPDDGTYDYVRRLKMLGEMDELFSRLRQLKVRQRAFLNSNEVNSSIEALFEARSKLIMGLNGKIRLVRGERNFGERPTPQSIDRTKRYDEIIWQDYAEGVDPITDLIDTALNEIESRMTPLVRLEI